MMQRKNGVSGTDALGHRIRDQIEDLDDRIARQIAEMEQRLDDAGLYPEDAETAPDANTAAQARDGLAQFGLLPATQAQRRNQAYQHSPFKEDEMELLKGYLEHLSTHSTNATEKMLVESFADPFTGEFMVDPVRLRTDGRTYHRTTLLEMIERKINFVNNIPFNAFDFENDYDKIALLNGMLENAKQLLRERSQQVSAPRV